METYCAMAHLCFTVFFFFWSGSWMKHLFAHLAASQQCIIPLLMLYLSNPKQVWSTLHPCSIVNSFLFAREAGFVTSSHWNEYYFLTLNLHVMGWSLLGGLSIWCGWMELGGSWAHTPLKTWGRLFTSVFLSVVVGRLQFYSYMR